jgi:hypothetical protein
VLSVEAERADARRVEREHSTSLGPEVEVAGGEHAQQVAVGEEADRAVTGGSEVEATEHAVDSSDDLIGSLPVGAALTE